ncbi:CBS domain-containing protein [Amycolatopsis sp. K13G38]|uniref:CBS domain-containing protein n=1 Tax=Amycolatopsis acididurans TaxID=2724524 RepID=A0ABX1J5V4_9PSEU|nr:CBS domain-containing protein [Amycolatopsis acididurans]NKQ54309.1 CBS domain-containing protein [Amycolatopsis acididurans]
MQVADIMSTPVIALPATATIAAAATVMVSRGYTTLPVVADDGRLVGIVTEAHLGRARFGQHTRPEDANIVTVMSDPHTTIPVDGDVTAVATALAETGERCLPVTRNAHVVGMISWRDLFRADLHGEQAGWSR